MKLFLKCAVMCSMFIMAVSLQGCLEEEELPKVTAGFTYTANEDTGTVTFLNISDNATKYLWDFGDSQTSKEIDPVKTYMSGTYIVTLTASNVSGGADIFKDTLDIAIRGVITIPATFDNPNINYDATAIEGAAYEVVDNPDQSGTNNKATKVASITNNGTAFEGVFWDLGTQLDLTTNKRITMNFWADEPVDVLLKLEQGTSAAVETSVAHGGTGWESLSFDYTSSAKYSRLTLFVDGPGTTAGTFYLDDIAQELIPSTGDPCVAETAQSLLATDFNLTFQTDPGSAIVNDGGTYTYTDNPDFDNLINKSCKVGQIVRDPSLPFANNQITFNSKFDFNANSGFKLKVRSSKVGYGVLLKLEDKTNGGIFKEATAMASVGANEWEELTFEFASSESGKYDKIVLFFELNSTNGDTYFIDDFMLYSSGGGGPTSGCTGTPVAAATLPLNFEGCETFLASENFGGGITSELAPNPSKSGINTSNFVLKVDKPTGSDFFAGIQNTFTPNFDLTTTDVFKLKVYSTKPNVTFRFELVVDPNPPPAIGNPAAVFRTITNANQWTEVEFTFTGLPGTTTDYNRLVIKPDNDMADSPITSGGTYYIDDITLAAGAGGGCSETVLKFPIDFDCESTAYNFATLNGASYQVIENPQLSGINNVASKVGEIVNIGANWEGGSFTLGTPLDLATDKGVTMKLYSTVAVPVLLKLESGTGPNTELTANHTGSGWEQLSWEFTSSSAFSVVTLFVDGPGNTAGTFYMDDLEQVSVGGGPGPGGNLISNGGFETGDATDWDTFANGGTITITDTEKNSGTYSAKLLAEPVPSVASFPVLKQEEFAQNQLTAGDQVNVTFKIKAVLTQPGAVVKVALFSEQTAGAVRHDITLPTFDNTWQTVTQDITTAGTLDPARGLSLEFQADCGGNVGCVIEMYIDDVSVTKNP